ncbi:hypothetical protein H4R34_000841 [Dimargaris verticillata]|uniref:Uncharacterized protein n=1 Tax=Dimargaris verticillata TaxID=2761393 RepID=A0A9W8B7B6_9FUNG|nr:hypothetical protein H4R34_000841 [Dimargaris verticillata]
MPHSPTSNSRHRRRHGSHRSRSPSAKSSRNRGYKSRHEDNSDAETRSRSPRRTKQRGKTTASAARASSPSEPRPAPADITPLTADDYYNKNTEFRVWLLRKKKLYFDELSSKDNRRYFKDFVTRWNQVTLSARYYRGMTTAELPASSKTRHQWSFTSKLLYDETQRQHRRDEVRRQRRDFRKTHEMVLEELVPKETGREARLDKRRVHNAYHQMDKAADVELDDHEILGDTTEDFQRRLAAERQRQSGREGARHQRTQTKTHQWQEKVAAHQAKEDATVAMLRRMAEQSREQNLGMFQKRPM